jgi:hypothetical protein
LLRIENAVSSIEGKIDAFFSYSGPVAQINERMSVVEDRATRAHLRVDELIAEFHEQSASLNKLTVKVAILTSAFTGGVVTTIMKLMG